MWSKIALTPPSYDAYNNLGYKAGGIRLGDIEKIKYHDVFD